jgi:ankyrin repeat protein
MKFSRLIFLVALILSNCQRADYKLYPDIKLQPTTRKGSFASKKNFESLLFEIWDSGFIEKNNLTRKEILNNTYGVFRKTEAPLAEPEGRAYFQQREGQKDILMLNAKLFGHLVPSIKPLRLKKTHVKRLDKLIRDTLVHELFHDFWYNILDERRKNLFSYEAEIFFIELMMAKTKKDKTQLLESFGYSQPEEEFFNFFKALQELKKTYSLEKAFGTELYATLAGRAFSGVTIIPNQFRKYYSGLLSDEALNKNLFFHPTGSIYAENFLETTKIGDLAQLKIILEEQPILVNAKDEDGWTLLHYASYAGIKEVVEYLMEKGAEVNTEARIGAWTPFFLSSLKGHREIAEWLIENGAKTDIQDNKSRSPLHVAVMRGHEEFIDFLIRHGAEINLGDALGMTPLHVAALSDQSEAASLLISKGANTKLKDFRGQTPLHLASLNRSKDMTELLIAEGINTSERDHRGETALHIAAFCGHNEVVESLIEGGAELDIKNIDGKTPLEIASEAGHKETVDMLRRFSPDLLN